MKSKSMSDRRFRSAVARRCFGWLLVLAGPIWCLNAAETPQFTSPLDNSPLEIKLLPNEKITEGVQKFYDTGENPYAGNQEALAVGKTIYETTCQACHMPDGSGRIGPSLIGDTHHYPRFTTDKGMFEIVYGGGTGAMQPFGKRLTQDQILRVMAYVRSLRK
jgi:cytochrome c-L